MCSAVKKCCTRLSLPLKNTVVCVMERYELTFTMIVRIFQIHQHWTLCKRICCCWTTVSWVSRIKLKRTTLVVDTTIAIRYTLPKTTPPTPPYNRENSNFIILFPQDTKNLTHIHDDHCAADIPLLEFKQFCHRVWSEDHNIVTIDLTSTPTNGKYRQNFNRFYFPTGTI